METVFNYRVKSPAVLSMLNNIYAIFLGLLFTYFINFRVDGDGESLQLRIMINSQNLAMVSLLASYFILDWLTAAITVPLKEDLLYLLPVVLIVLISVVSQR